MPTIVNDGSYFYPDSGSFEPQVSYGDGYFWTATAAGTIDGIPYAIGDIVYCETPVEGVEEGDVTWKVLSEDTHVVGGFRIDAEGNANFGPNFSIDGPTGDVTIGGSGTIQSGNYDAPDGAEVFADAGTKLTLSDGVIKSKHMVVDEDGVKAGAFEVYDAGARIFAVEGNDQANTGYDTMRFESSLGSFPLTWTIDWAQENDNVFDPSWFSIGNWSNVSGTADGNFTNMYSGIGWVYDSANNSARWTASAATYIDMGETLGSGYGHVQLKTGAVNWTLYDPSNPATLPYIQTNATTRGSDGSTAEPTYSFAGDTNTGVFRKAEGQLGISCNGTQHYFTNAGLYLAPDDWFRTTGDVGWYSQTWGGGVYMIDGTWVRSYAGTGYLSEGGLAIAAPATTTTYTGFQDLLWNTSVGSVHRYSSLRAMKERIEPLSASVDSGAVIDLLKPVTFIAAQSSDSEEPETSAEKEMREADLVWGFVAEDVCEIDETTGARLGVYEPSEDGEGFQPAAWAQRAFFPLLVAELQELRKRVAALEAEKRLDVLEAQVAKLLRNR